MSEDTHIGPNHPNDGREWDCQCARCGSSMESVPCEACGGEGVWESDGFGDETRICGECGGEAMWLVCLSSAEWCEAHPIIGREGIKRGEVEWFVVEPHPNTP